MISIAKESDKDSSKATQFNQELLDNLTKILISLEPRQDLRLSKNLHWSPKKLKREEVTPMLDPMLLVTMTMPLMKEMEILMVLQLLKEITTIGRVMFLVVQNVKKARGKDLPREIKEEMVSSETLWKRMLMQRR
jgi:hypothetical protein